MKTLDKKETARNVLAEVSGRPAAEIRDDMQLVADLGIDSPKALELLVELEDALGVEISDEEAARMESVGDVVRYAAAC
ncbi:MAG: acyl carrier protein [Acidobacteria bacterium]|nr:MAG: acyl carrier protein [Acidobacteriota bacterium]